MHGNPSTKLVVGLLVVLFQATVNRGSVVPCVSAECIGFNAVGLAIWGFGLWLIFRGVQGLLARKRAAPPPRLHRR
jgi:hypothetical protein